MASTGSATGRPPAHTRPAEASEDPENPEKIDGLLAPLLTYERGFVLGLLLSRGAQEQREDTARVLSGPPGDRCADAIRQANALSREGRLSLIRRLAGEVLGTSTESFDVFAFPDDRLAQALTRESTGILQLLATASTSTSTSTDILTLCATRELARRDPHGSPSTWETSTGPLARDDRIELRRALLARLAASPARDGS